MARKYMNNEETRHINGLMVSAGYNIGKMAEELGMSRATLSTRINGKTDFSRSEMQRMADILRLPPADIFFSKKVAF